jgi:hypothetical protein
VHHEKVVQIEEVKSGETEETRNRGFPVSILRPELKGSVLHADAQVHGTNDCSVDETRLGDNQQ